MFFKYNNFIEVKKTGITQNHLYPLYRFSDLLSSVYFRRFLFLIFLLLPIFEDATAQNDANTVFVRSIDSETYFIHLYTSVGTRNFSPPAGVSEIEYLVVGGGGGGGGGNGDRGGGGAGGFVTGELTITDNNIPITVGDGGAGGFGVTIEDAMGENGENSSIGNIIIARGGGGGGAFINDGVDIVPGGDGGSGGGGGGGALFVPGGESTQSSEPNPGAVQNLGNNGGAGVGGGFGSGRNAGGGGGGAESPGENSSSTSNNAGNGGNGQSSNITGFTVFYAGGGGGAGFNNGGTGGIGGGGNGGSGANGNGQHGDTNSGGGGGAGNTSGNGGSGIVIIRYKAADISDYIATTITADQFIFDDDITFPANKILTLTGTTLVTSVISVDANTTLTFNDNLTVEGSLNIGSSGTINLISGTITTIDNGGSVSSSGILNVESDALFCNFGTSDPTINISRKLKMAEGWRILSSPASVSYTDLFGSIWTQGATGANFTGGSPNVYTWPENMPDSDSESLRQEWIPITNLHEISSPGKGILLYLYESDADGDNSGWPKELTVAGSEQGTLIFPNLNTATDGWSLLGNPFACAISFEQLLNQSSTNNLTHSVYVWDPNDNSGTINDSKNPAGSWKTYNNTTNSGDLTGGIIMPFQAFFVQNSDANSSVEFNNSIKTPVINDFLGKAMDTQNMIRFELSGEHSQNSTWLNFSESGSFEQNSGDTFQLQPFSEHYSILASIKSGKFLDIGHYPLPDHNYRIPLAIETTRPGNYTLAATDYHLSGYYDLYFHDTQENTIILIDDSFSYSFRLNPKIESLIFKPLNPTNNKILNINTDFGSRFYLTTSKAAIESVVPQSVALLQNYPNPFNPNTNIRFELPEPDKVKLSIYDMIGRKIITLVDKQMSAGVHQVTFEAGNLSSGTYLYRLEAGNTILTKKLSLIK